MHFGNAQTCSKLYFSRERARNGPMLASFLRACARQRSCWEMGNQSSVFVLEIFTDIQHCAVSCTRAKIIVFRQFLMETMFLNSPNHVPNAPFLRARAAPRMSLSRAREKQFDPSWEPDVQKAWIESLTKLYDSMNS